DMLHNTAVGQFKKFDMLTADLPSPTAAEYPGTHVLGQAAVIAFGAMGDVNYHLGFPAIAPHLNFDNLNKQIGYWESLEAINLVPAHQVEDLTPSPIPTLDNPSASKHSIPSFSPELPPSASVSLPGVVSTNCRDDEYRSTPMPVSHSTCTSQSTTTIPSFSRQLGNDGCEDSDVELAASYSTSQLRKSKTEQIAAHLDVVSKMDNTIVNLGKQFELTVKPCVDQFISLVFQFKKGAASISQAAYQNLILQEFLENPTGERQVPWRKIDDTAFDSVLEPSAEDQNFMKGKDFYWSSSIPHHYSANYSACCWKTGTSHYQDLLNSLGPWKTESPMEFTLEGFGDADFAGDAGDAETHRSTSGAV
ncbi:UNVERIFIED_CONTAM: hypothetical protein HDU68_005807, partial [Siphonaria sp. JEL0065]